MTAADDASSGNFSPTAAASDVPRIDGRHQRSARTRQMIIEAYLALLRENPNVPTAARIAERAGYSVRSVFERFPDLHALRVAATDYILAQATAQAVAGNVHGDRQTRLKAYVEIRGRNCEYWLPLWRSLVANQGESTELRRRVVALRERFVERLEAMYAPELSTLPVVERRHLLIVLEALTDIESWARMQEFFGLSFDQACAAWAQAIDRLLPPTPAGA